ncbi:hypothetical protein, partial [Caballeronia sp. AAUFL_F3_KS11A]|uniref:hypothetical protein n=1 Tax=Caballeronia sp. AAUFL_F3_KS11A TaxID=2921774 RepID=UPI0020279571
MYAILSAGLIVSVAWGAQPSLDSLLNQINVEIAEETAQLHQLREMWAILRAQPGMAAGGGAVGPVEILVDNNGYPLLDGSGNRITRD